MNDSEKFRIISDERKRIIDIMNEHSRENNIEPNVYYKNRIKPMIEKFSKDGLYIIYLSSRHNDPNMRNIFKLSLKNRKNVIKYLKEEGYGVSEYSSQAPDPAEEFIKISWSKQPNCILQ